MRVLVTGAEGFIGRRVTAEIVRRWPGTEVMGLAARDDILDDLTLDLCRLFEPDALVHLAAMHFVPWCRAHPKETLETNVEGTQRVLRALPDVRNVVIASSAAVYGLQATDSALSEGHDLKPDDVYGYSKALNEAQLEGRSIMAGEGRYVAARLFNVVGPDDPHAHIVPIMLAARGKTAAVDMEALRWARDFVHVDDAATSLVDLLAIGPAGFTAVNVCSGAATTGWDLTNIFDVSVVDNADARRDGGGYLVGSNALLRSITGRVPSEPWTRL